MMFSQSVVCLQRSLNTACNNWNVSNYVAPPDVCLVAYKNYNTNCPNIIEFLILLACLAFVIVD